MASRVWDELHVSRYIPMEQGALVHEKQRVPSHHSLNPVQWVWALIMGKLRTTNETNTKMYWGIIGTLMIGYQDSKHQIHSKTFFIFVKYHHAD